MRQHWRLNSLLMEILIAVLFFALCAGVIVNVLATSSYQSTKAGHMMDMLDLAQNVSDRLYASEDMAKELAAMGFAEADGKHVRTEEAGTLAVTLRQEKQESGVIHVADLTVQCVDGGQFELSSTHYIPEEVR